MQGICFYVWIGKARAATAHSDFRSIVCHDFCKVSLNLCVNLMDFCGTSSDFLEAGSAGRNSIKPLPQE